MSTESTVPSTETFNSLVSVICSLNIISFNEYVETVGGYSDARFHFIGQIDQVRIFNKALTQLEVTTLYTEK